MNDTIERLLKQVSKEVEGLVPEGQPRELYEPVSYCLSLGGKRMRPVMTLLGCELFGGNAQKAMSAAIGLELFHNFTLMHDDIMDNAPIRRGKPSVHMKWSANTAILSGDVMFALAYQHMMGVDDAYLRPIMALFNKTVLEVCEGQQYDMNFEAIHHVSGEQYIEMIRLKTAVLPAACLKTGAIIANAPEKDADHLYRFGEGIGIGFQIKDDWLDVFGDETTFGKKSGGDIVSNKKTWLYIKALEQANGQQRQLLLDAYASKPTGPEEKIRQVKDVFLDLNIDKLALAEMDRYYDKAFEALHLVQVSDEAKHDLILLANSLFNRVT
jgi:geranylgeranyl diphosphate synthase, type II